VAFFFAYNTSSEVEDFKRFLVVYLGSDPAVEARLQGAVTAALEDFDRFERDYPEAAG
jgi:hypothetical protein